MSYVDAAIAPMRKTGQIKLHKSEAFAGMRKAGQLVAQCLDMLVPEVQPGVPVLRSITWCATAFPATSR